MGAEVKVRVEITLIFSSVYQQPRNNHVSNICF